MSREKAEKYLTSTLFPDGMESSLLGIYQVQHYGDLRAEEEREKLLEEWRAEDVAKWLFENGVDTLFQGPFSRRVEARQMIHEALARARTQGAAEAKRELHEVQALIHRPRYQRSGIFATPSRTFAKAHTTNCAVHNSRACDCGRTDNA